MNIEEDKKKEKEFLRAAREKSAKKGRSKEGIERVIAINAKKAEEKRELEEAKKDINVLLEARKARKSGLDSKEQSRIFKHLSGARKRKTARKIAQSIE